jgi:hypothetical protein
VNKKIEMDPDFKIEMYKNFKKHPYFENIEINEDGNIVLYHYDSIIPFKNYLYENKLFVNIPIHVSRLVAETWNDPENNNYKEYTQVHHISNNGFDNSKYNLIWVNKLQHKYIENRF